MAKEKDDPMGLVEVEGRLGSSGSASPSVSMPTTQRRTGMFHNIVFTEDAPRPRPLPANIETETKANEARPEAMPRSAS